MEAVRRLWFTGSTIPTGCINKEQALCAIASSLMVAPGIVSTAIGLALVLPMLLQHLAVAHGAPVADRRRLSQPRSRSTPNRAGSTSGVWPAS